MFYAINFIKLIKTLKNYSYYLRMIFNLFWSARKTIRLIIFCEYPSEGLNFNSDINNVRMWIILSLYKGGVPHELQKK